MTLRASASGYVPQEKVVVPADGPQGAVEFVLKMSSSWYVHDARVGYGVTGDMTPPGYVRSGIANACAPSSTDEPPPWTHLLLRLMRGHCCRSSTMAALTARAWSPLGCCSSAVPVLGV